MGLDGRVAQSIVTLVCVAVLTVGDSRQLASDAERIRVVPRVKYAS